MKKQQRLPISTLFFIMIFLCSFITACFFGYRMITDEQQRNRAREEYDTIIVEYAKPVDKIQQEIIPDERPVLLYPQRNIDHNALKNINSDYIGWLYFPFDGNSEEYSFTLDYPIVYETYKNQYLRTTFEGQHNNAGTIFMDMMSNPSFYGYNDMIYGHHMADDSMFGELELVHQMDSVEYLKNNPQFLYIYTKTACHVYILAAYEQANNSNGIAYSVAYDNKAYDKIKEHIKSLDTYMPSNHFTWTGRPEILNLSTCDGPSGTSRRFILHFIKIMAYAYES